ncbi:MAG TPA: ascorbate-dependent monooxygenase [Thermoanaerobaculia bacterium]|jgi:hypothetical protein
MRRAALVLALVSATFAAEARTRAVRKTPPPVNVTGPTFSKEVVRIFQQHCQSCHHEGDIAPFPLVEYADAAPRALLIKFMTQSHQMPPWKPEQGCGEFEGERRLSAGEIDTIVKWVNSGAPEGNRADLPQPLEFTSAWRLGEPDLVLRSAEAFTAPEGQDTYRCFSLPTNLTSTTYVRAVDTHPEDRESVHHLISFIDTTGASQRLDDAEPGPGYTCFGGPGFDTTGTLGGWAPGSPPFEMPDDVGFELPAGARVVLQVHYHPHHGAPEPDRTELAVYFSEKKPSKLMRILPLINDTFIIPPNVSNYEVPYTFPILTPYKMKLWLIAPHMHLLGKKMRVEMTPLNGTPQCLIDIEDWDFNWQGSYRYKKPIDIPVGTKLSLRAIYDNSSDNPLNPNVPPKPVGWGEATTDEMCIAFLGVTLE